MPRGWGSLAQRKQKRTKSVSRPDPNDKIQPSECAGDKEGPALQGEGGETHSGGQEAWGPRREAPGNCWKMRRGGVPRLGSP